jgi:prephenate dehydrogenase
MRRYDKITVIGVGLLGGSIGLAAKRKRLARRVVGYFRNPRKIGPAVRRGIIDVGTTDLKEAVRGADIVVLCTPVSDIEHKLHQLKQLSGRATLITDTGSTKTTIVRAAGRMKNFVGAHPLAGSEQSGAAAARADLFQGSPCILTPRSKDTFWKRAVLFWNTLGCRVFTMKPARHDFILSRTSHLPHLAAFALMATIPAETLSFAAGGLKDTTRIALSSPELWTDIFLANRRHMLSALASFEDTLEAFKAALRSSRRPKVLSLTTAGQRKRRSAR